MNFEGRWVFGGLFFFQFDCGRWECCAWGYVTLDMNIWTQSVRLMENNGQTTVKLPFWQSKTDVKVSRYPEYCTLVEIGSKKRCWWLSNGLFEKPNRISQMGGHNFATFDPSKSIDTVNRIHSLPITKPFYQYSGSATITKWSIWLHLNLSTEPLENYQRTIYQ